MPHRLRTHSESAPLLPGLTGVPGLTFPLANKIATPAAAPVVVTATSGEFFGRGLLIGLTAIINTLVLGFVPYAGLFLAPYAFTVISLAAVIFVARNRVYQGFLGWSAWLFPVSHIATAVGLLLLVVNIPFALGTFGFAAFSIDWTTGVIQTAGGLSAVFTGGFSLGNFTFLNILPAAGSFTAPSLPSHETGHSLNTAACGGVLLWINAIDENIFPLRKNLAYGELAAEGHSRNMPGTPVNDYSIRLWF